MYLDLYISGERQRGLTTMPLLTLGDGAFWEIGSFLVEQKKPVRCPWQNTDFLRILL